MNHKLHAIKHLKQQVGCSLFAAKQAFDNANGSYEGALDDLRASNQIPNTLKLINGCIENYTHTGSSLAVMVEVRCTTASYALTECFRSFASQLAMHIAAMHPLYLSREYIINEEIIKKNNELTNKANSLIQLETELKKDHFIREKKARWYSDICLLDQRWIHDDSKNVGEVIYELSNLSGERIEIFKWVRWQLGE